jgi:hypothetical protein
MSKHIVVQWVKETKYGYGMAMLVIKSTHERFSVGTRFDYGFFNIATREGYTITSFPIKHTDSDEQVEDPKEDKQAGLDRVEAMCCT